MVLLDVFWRDPTRRPKTCKSSVINLQRIVMQFNSYKLSSLVCVSLLLSACSQTPKVDHTKLTLLEPRYGHATVTDGAQLITLGGTNNNGFLSDIETFNPKTGEQKKLNVQIMPRRYFSAIFDGEHRIYIIGGDGDGPEEYNAGHFVEMLDLQTNKVSIVNQMPAPTAFGTSVLFKEEILVFGGITYRHQAGVPHQTPQAWVHAFNLKSQSWRRLYDLPVARTTKAVVKDDWVYLVGGYDGKNSLPMFERYQPTTGKVEKLPDIPQPISAHSVTVVGNQLLVFGDYTQMDASYSYDFTSQRWQKLPVGYQPSRHQSIATIADTVYVTGGNTARRALNRRR